MGYLIMKSSVSDKQSDNFLKDDVEEIVGESAQTYVDKVAMSPEMKKTLIEWAMYLGKVLLTTVAKKLLSK